MCQLLGVCANRPVNIDFSLREWRYRGRSNPHGYGFAFWKRKHPAVIKEPVSLFKKVLEEGNPVYGLRSHMFICHVRYASVGLLDGSNTHPFVCALGEKEYVFAHNGTLLFIKERPLHSLKPEGETDSEHAFLWMLEQLEGTPESHLDEHLRAIALDILESEPADRARFNFLMSDGRTLWAFADNSLHYIERRPPFGGTLVSLRDARYSISLAEVKGPDERAVLVATVPLTDEAGWRRLRRGKLLVVRHGRVVRIL